MTPEALLLLFLHAHAPMAREAITDAHSVILYSQTARETQRGGLHLVGALDSYGRAAVQLLDRKGRARCQATGLVDLSTGELLEADGGCSGVAANR